MGFLDSIRSRVDPREATGDGDWFPLRAGSIMSVAGESNYQRSIERTIRGAAAKPPYSVEEWPLQISREEQLPWFAAYLRREPDNRYDANAIAVSTRHGLIGYLPRHAAKAFQPVLELLELHGHRGAACPAYGRRADNGMWGVVLALSGAQACLNHVKMEKSFRVEPTQG